MTAPSNPRGYETASMSRGSISDNRAAIDSEAEIRNTEMRKQGAKKVITQYVSASGKVLREISETL